MFVLMCFLFLKREFAFGVVFGVGFDFEVGFVFVLGFDVYCLFYVGCGVDSALDFDFGLWC